MKAFLALVLAGYVGHTALNHNSTTYDPQQIAAAATTNQLTPIDGASSNTAPIDPNAAQNIVAQSSELSTQDVATLNEIKEKQAKIAELQQTLQALKDNPDAILPKADSTGMIAKENPEAKNEMDSAVQTIDQAVRMTPTVAIAMAENFSKHGLYAFVYDDPETKKVTDQFGSLVGAGIRHLAQSAAKDMTTSN